MQNRARRTPRGRLCFFRGLFLQGAGESGKTTVFKQMRVLYGVEETAEERQKAYEHVVYNNIVASLKLMAGYGREQKDQFDLSGVADNLAVLDATAPEGPLTPANGPQLKALWQSDEFKKIWDAREHYQIVDSVEGYFNDLDRIYSDDYAVSKADALLVRVRDGTVLVPPRRAAAADRLLVLVRHGGCRAVVVSEQLSCAVDAQENSCVGTLAAQPAMPRRAAVPGSRGERRRGPQGVARG